MSNDLTPLDLGGELSPLDSGSLESADFEAPSWLQEIDNEPYTSLKQNQAHVFGQKTDMAQSDAEQVWLEIGNMFERDMTSLSARYGISQTHIRAAKNWLMSNAFKPPQPERAVHGYSIPRYLTDFCATTDDHHAVTAFLNSMHRTGVPERSVQIFLGWYRELGKRAEASMQQSASPAGNAQFIVIDDLSEQQWQFVKKKADGDRQRAEEILRSKWGSEYESRLATVKGYIRSMPRQDQEFLSYGVAGDGTMLANSPELMEQLFMQASGLNRPPADLAGEIAAIEKVMREDRKRYLRDQTMQERLRHLYELRDGE